MVGATTRTPEEIPSAIRSRCVEIFFRPLLAQEIARIADQAIKRIGFDHEPAAVDVIKKYATNGREAVNMVQTAGGLALTEGKKEIRASDVEWVVHSSQLTPRPDKKVPEKAQPGLVNGLAIHGPNMGILLEIEVTAIPAGPGQKGSIQISGLVDEEELGGRHRTLRRKSMARSSVDNVLTVLRRTDIDPYAYHLHLNFPGGVPLDGPSAGIAMASAIYSAIRGDPGG